jgi:hypothetical protein
VRAKEGDAGELVFVLRKIRSYRAGHFPRPHRTADDYHIIGRGVARRWCDFRADPQECLHRQPGHTLVFHVGHDRFNIGVEGFSKRFGDLFRVSRPQVIGYECFHCCALCRTRFIGLPNEARPVGIDRVISRFGGAIRMN